jgi:hypothetical protein
MNVKFSGNFLSKFRDNLSVPSSGGFLKKGPIGCPETSVTNNHYSLHNNPEEAVLSYFAEED